MDKQYHIIQIGSFDVENYGDLLFPIVLENELKKRIKIKKMSLFSPNGGKMPFYGKRVYPISKLDDFCFNNDVDAIVVGGGDIIRFDKTVLRDYSNSFMPALSMWQYPVVVANKYHIPIIFNSPGVPFELGKYSHITQTTLSNVDYLSVRDKNSYKFLKTTGISSKVILDTINIVEQTYPKDYLDLEFKKLKHSIKNIESKYVVLQTNKGYFEDKNYLNNICKTIEIINNKYNLQVVLSPIGYVHDDLMQLEKIYKHISKRNSIIRTKMSPIEMLSLFSHSSAFIGSSLHGLITTNIFHIPIFAININNYLKKVSGYMEMCGLSKNMIFNINDLPQIINKRLLKKNHYYKLDKEINKVNKHFDDIAHIIKNSKDEKNNERFFFEILDQLYLLSDC